ncbi:MAG: hypothetical protein GY853_08290 [PVC group bacterium]|nr:hypothetical protein [PVC group bacterium]
MDKEFSIGQEIPFGSENKSPDPMSQPKQFDEPSLDPDLDPDLGDPEKPKSKKSSSTNLLTIILVILTVSSVSGAIALYVIKEDEVNKRMKTEADLETMTLEKQKTENNLQVTLVAKNEIEADLTQTREDFKKTLSELSSTEDKLKETTKLVDDKEKMISSLNASLKKQEKAQEKLNDKFKVANRDLQQLKVQLSQIRMAKESLENRIIQLGKKRKPNAVELEKIVVEGDKNVSDIPNPAKEGHYVRLPAPASLEGQVLVVNKEFAFVVINIGQKDGLQESEVLEVYRGREFLGKVQVERIYDTMSSAVILPEFKKEDIKEGDAVKLI